MTSSTFPRCVLFHIYFTIYIINFNYPIALYRILLVLRTAFTRNARLQKNTQSTNNSTRTSEGVFARRGRRLLCEMTFTIIVDFLIKPKAEYTYSYNIIGLGH